MKLIYIFSFFTFYGSACANFLFENEEKIHSFSKRLFDSKISEFNDAPFMALVEAEKYGDYCTATIISRRLLISGAKFFSLYQGTKMLVMTEVDRDGVVKPENIYEIEKIHIHPNFTSMEKYHDIALIELKEEIKTNSLAKPIHLLTENDFLQKSNQLMKVFGYGMRGPTTGEITRILSSKSFYVDTDIVDLKASFLVLGANVDLGIGDSGSPLIFDGKLAGVAIYTTAFERRFPGIFTGIVNHYDWIAMEMGKINLKYISYWDSEKYE